MGNIDTDGKRCCHYGGYDVDDHGMLRINRNGHAIRLTCVAMNDTAANEYIYRGDCGTVNCPFYKPKPYLIRKGDQFFYDDGREYVWKGEAE